MWLVTKASEAFGGPVEVAQEGAGAWQELVENLDSDDLRGRYCAAREDGLTPSFGECLARANITA